MAKWGVVPGSLDGIRAKTYSNWVESKVITTGETRLIENTLGLVGEAGEVAEKIKKLMRDGTEVDLEGILKEIGDVVFYAAALANHLGGDLEKVLDINIKKLDDRYDRGTIQGSGDNR